MSDRGAKTVAVDLQDIKDLLRNWMSEWVALASEYCGGAESIARRSTLISVKPGGGIVRIENPCGRIDIGLDELNGAYAAPALAAALRDTETNAGKRAPNTAVLNVSDAAILRLRLRLPAMSSRNLENAIQIELRRLTPIDLDQLYYDFQAERSEVEAGFRNIDVRMVRRSVVDAIVSLCHSAGVRVGAIFFGSDLREGNWARLPLDRFAVLKLRWCRFGNFVLGGLAAVLLAIVLTLGHLRNLHSAEMLSQELADAMSRTAVLERVQQKAHRAASQITVLGQKQNDLSLSSTLASLSTLLPDNTWLTEVLVNENKVRIIGRSRSSAELIAIIDRSDRFTNAQFDAPVLQDNSDNTERFDLIFEIRSARK